MVVTFVLATFCGLGIWLLRPGLSPDRLAAIMARQNKPLLEIAEPLMPQGDAIAAERARQAEIDAIVDSVLARVRISLVSDPAVSEQLRQELRIWLDSNIREIAAEYPAAAGLTEAEVAAIADERFTSWVEYNSDVIYREADRLISHYVSIAVHEAVTTELRNFGLSEEEVSSLADERIAAWLDANSGIIAAELRATGLTEAEVADIADQRISAWLTSAAAERVSTAVDEAIATRLEESGGLLTEKEKAVLVEEITTKVIQSMYGLSDTDGSGTGEFAYVWGEPEFARIEDAPVAVEVSPGNRETYLHDRDAQRGNIRELVTNRLLDF